jgi:hypothetical protein
MVKRIVAAPLWFLAVWTIYSLVAYVVGLPFGRGAILGALVASFIVLDPTGALWNRRTRQPERLEPAQSAS